MSYDWTFQQTDYIDANLIRAKNLINEVNAKLAGYL